jgi:hypothetical protein
MRHPLHRASIFPGLAIALLGCHHDVNEIKPALSATDASPFDAKFDGSNGDRHDARPDAPPTSVVLSGTVRLFSSTDPNSYEPGVTVRVTNTTPALSSKSSSSGVYMISGLPLSAAIDIELDLTQMVPAVDGSVNVLPSISTRLSTQLTSQAAQTLDLPIVTYAWMAQVAYQCGIFSTPAAAEMSMGATNSYFLKRSTIFGKLVDATGTPKSGVAKTAITVNIDGWENKDPNPNDSDAQPTKVCFLDAGSSGTYIGTSSTMSLGTGVFAVFRVRDPDSPDAGTFGLGNGIARVQATGFVSQTVNLPASGNIGVVTLPTGQDPTPSFQNDVFPIFRALQCSSCHAPGSATADAGVGYADSPQHLDLSLSKTAPQIYQELIADSVVDGGSCASATPIPILCHSMPAMSLLLENLLGQNNHPEMFVTDTTDTNYQTILRWISAGAPNN